MVLELIAEFDPFLADHISRFGNKGIGSTSYLSKTIYISHVDQLCLMLRYVNKDGTPVERFVTFLQNVGHKAADMDDAVISTLKTLQIDIENCRGQSYDTARNMSGIYAGLQQLIKNRNEYADYVPCAAHSLNLVGTHAVENCSEAANFFNDLQSLYNFFSASTSRWDVLQCCCKKSERIVLKSLSITRWSARNDAVRTLEYYTEILQALYSIEHDVSQKAAIRSEAKGIRNRFELLETAFMQCLWSFLLSRFNSVSKKLQSTQTNLNEVVRLYKSLIKTVGDAREDFDYFEKKAFDLSVNQEYKTEVCRVKRRKIYDDETRTGEVTLLGKDNFKVNTYNVIFDNLLADIQERCKKYETIYEKFSVLIDFMNMDIADIRGKVQILQGAFNKDLESSLDDELIHFKAYLDCDKQNLKQLTPIETFKFLKKNDLDSVFPNVDIAYRMFLCMAVTNCS
ncbi:PREDICTED: zinc finger MYM-type protein 1-like, partial [Trachymyrmex cornetzi]|uniref:zinc finger MYM-type protein 1-like n=1 Tax=Trachymyrmex cornetzi TaxID=471704 RepID=UPI00084EDE9C